MAFLTPEVIGTCLVDADGLDPAGDTVSAVFNTAPTNDAIVVFGICVYDGHQGAAMTHQVDVERLYYTGDGIYKGGIYLAYGDGQTTTWSFGVFGNEQPFETTIYCGGWGAAIRHTDWINRFGFKAQQDGLNTLQSQQEEVTIPIGGLQGSSSAFLKAICITKGFQPVESSLSMLYQTSATVAAYTDFALANNVWDVRIGTANDVDDSGGVSWTWSNAAGHKKAEWAIELLNGTTFDPKETPGWRIAPDFEDLGWRDRVLTWGNVRRKTSSHKRSFSNGLNGIQLADTDQELWGSTFGE